MILLPLVWAIVIHLNYLFIIQCIFWVQSDFLFLIIRYFNIFILSSAKHFPRWRYFISVQWKKNIVNIYPMYITAAKMAFFPSCPGQPHKNVRGYSIIFRAQLGYKQVFSFLKIIQYGTAPWPLGKLVYNYQCNQCISPLTLWVRIPIRRDVLDTRICDKVCQWFAAARCFLRVLRFLPPIKLITTIY
jgi:hypothetical protein